jgi:hypothetical protein
MIQIVAQLVLHNLKRKQSNKQPLTKLEKQILKDKAFITKEINKSVSK